MRKLNHKEVLTEGFGSFMKKVGAGIGAATREVGKQLAKDAPALVGAAKGIAGIAKDINARTMAITFNDTGRITRDVKVPVIYDEKRNNMPMKSYYELAFMYIFEKLLSTFDTGKFTHTNFE